MFKIIHNPLPPGITEEYIQELRQRSERRRKAEELAWEILGEKTEEPEMNLMEYLFTHPFPDVDIDYSIFDRNAHLRGTNVSD